MFQRFGRLVAVNFAQADARAVGLVSGLVYSQALMRTTNALEMISVGDIILTVTLSFAFAMASTLAIGIGTMLAYSAVKSTLHRP